MNLELKGRLALVTGSTRGLGKAIAEALAAEGADIIINGRWSKTVGNVAYEIEHKFGHNIHVYQCACDATDPKKIKEFFSGKMLQISHLDILVNNIGNLEKFGNFFELEDENWLRCYDLTCMSAVRFTREAIPYLERSGRGRIINISSLSSHQPGNFSPHYSAAKAAMNNLTKHLANVLGGKNILVNAVCPSTLSSGGWAQNIIDRSRRDGITTEQAEQLMRNEDNKKSPLGRIGMAEDVANLVVYLASDKANFLTGHIFDIDGGITRGV